MTEPDRERIRLWVDALRSGDYEQGQGALGRRRQSDGICVYCVLGVACEVAMKNGLPLLKFTAENGVHVGHIFAYGVGKSEFRLPPEVSGWYGLGSDNPELVLASGARLSAVTLNDGTDGRSFGYLAGVIEHTYLRED